nr:MAG: RNA-dependent RNA polymerase [Wufeng shrew reo-like virus 4]
MILNIKQLEEYINQHKTYANNKIKEIRHYFDTNTSLTSKAKKHLLPWEYWKTKKKENVDIIVKQYQLDYDKLLTEAKKLNENFGRISSILRNNVPITSLYNSELKEFDYDFELDCIDNICSMNRDAILLILKSVNVLEPIPCTSDPCQIQPASDFSFNKLCDRYMFGMVTWSEGQRIPVSKYRYIVNCEVKSSLKAFKDELELSEELTDRKREAMLYQKFLTKTLNQTRSINIAKMCLANILMIHSCPINNNTLHHCTSEQNPSIYYLQQLLSPYISWPFLDTTTEMYYPNDLKMSSQLPILIYTVLNKSIAYRFGVITVGYFNLLMKTFLEWAKISLDDEHLLQKGNMNKVHKLLNDKVIDSFAYVYLDSSIIGTRKVHLEKEFWYGNEFNELSDILTATKTTQDYFKYFKDLNSRNFHRDELILHKMALENCSNNTTFKKSSPAMEYERSAKPRLNKPITHPHAKEMINGFSIEPRYTGMLKRVWDNLISKSDEIAERLRNHDFQAEFYERLTNNASGLTQAHIQQSKLSHPILKTFTSAPYGQRYITALVDNEVLFNKTNALDSVTSWVMAGKREQIDRRVRWIMMVLNVLQAVFSVSLTVGKEQHKTVPYVASGKQVGNIKDMLQVLSTSIDVNTVITDNDIVGMDSSTQEQIVGLVLSFVYHTIGKIGDADYFYSRGRVAISEIFDELGMKIGIGSHQINGIQDYMIDVISAMRSNNFIFSDTFVGSEVTIPGSVYWSGSYSTASGHNVWLSETVSILNDEVMSEFTETQVRLVGSILGDDLSVGIKQNSTSDVSDRNATKVIAKLIAMLHDAGFEADPESSRCSSTFLQQTGFYGAVKPKFARLALNVSEHEIARTRDPISQIKEIGDILDEMSGRSPDPEAAINILNSYWVVNRSINLVKGIEYNSSFIKRVKVLLSLVNEKYLRWIKVSSETSVRLVIPFCGIYLKEVFGNTFPGFYSVLESKLMRPSFLSAKGTFTERCMFELSYIRLTRDEQLELIEKDRIHKLSKLNDKFRNGKISLNDYNVRKDLPGRINVSEKINFDRLERLGFTFVQWLTKNVITKARMSKRDSENPNFDVLVNIGKAKQNQKRSALAHLGANELEQANVSINQSLIYYNQPRSRIQQAFALKQERGRKFGDRNESILDGLISFLTLKRREFQFSDINLLDYKIIHTELDVEYSKDQDIIASSTLGPCASQKTIHFIGLQLFGFPFDIPSRDAAVESFKNVLSFGADAELVLSNAVDILNKKPKYLSSFFYAIGIPTTDHKRMENIVKEFRFNSILKYTGIFNVRKFFYFTPHTRNTLNLSIYKPSQFRKRNWGILHSMIIRDYFLAYPETKKKLMIQVSDIMTDELMDV